MKNDLTRIEFLNAVKVIRMLYGVAIARDFYEKNAKNFGLGLVNYKPMPDTDI